MERRRQFNLRRNTRVYYGSDGLGEEGGDEARKVGRGQGKKFSLRWNMQSQHVLNELGRLLRMEETGAGDWEGITDVSLFSSEGECVHAHKIVLMLCSPYFKKMFNQVGKAKRREPGGNTVVVLNNVRIGQLRHLVQFMYTGVVNLSTGRELEEFQRIARYFGMVGLSSTGRTIRRQQINAAARKQINHVDPAPSQDETVLVSGRAGNDEEVKGEEAKPRASKSEEDEEVGGDEDDGSVECKLEPEDITLDSAEENMDFGGGGVPHLEDDTGSNFSDALGNPEYSSAEDNPSDKDDPSVSFANVNKPPRKSNKGRPSKPRGDGNSEDLKLNWRTGKISNWIRIDALSDDELKKDWRKKNTIEVASNISHIYYCPYGGKKCPVTLKIKILRDGTSIYFRNAYDHANHRDPNYYSFGLTKEQKQFVNECLDNGICQPNNILLKFELAGLRKPEKTKLNNMLSRYRKRCPEKFGKKPEPKWPRRIRKKKPSEGPPKKRGRPSAASKEQAVVASTSATSPSAFLQSHNSQHQPHSQIPPLPPTSHDSTSSSPVPPNATGNPPGISFQPHPNHFLGQAAFPSPFSQLPPHYPFENLR